MSDNLVKKRKTRLEAAKMVIYALGVGWLACGALYQMTFPLGVSAMLLRVFLFSSAPVVLILAWAALNEREQKLRAARNEEDINGAQAEGAAR